MRFLINSLTESAYRSMFFSEAARNMVGLPEGREREVLVCIMEVRVAVIVLLA
jgi:hypothetical protein